ncbi:hypothetical protein B0H17DRAFT_1298339 [Mycena rosella]|uniref:Uncharacterized protein n=1 Tax=Mycena rosella TaxID=1033263 RepID=A0AAD7M8A0_MYCRO|nr:hypothetical protein B0H17DRAFT_1298339 [Mycena rosella]
MDHQLNRAPDQGTDDPSHCVGRESDRTQCICKRCSQKTVVDGRTICDNCGHIESPHPELPAPPVAVGSLIRQYRDAGRLASTPTTSASSQPKATAEDAELETNSNLRKKRKSGATDHEPPTSKKLKGKSTKERKEMKGEYIELGQIVALTWGTSGRPGSLTLNRTKAPNAKDISFMHNNGLAVMAVPGNPLRINTAWTAERCTEYFATLFPDLFRHLDRHPPKADAWHSHAQQQQQWLGVIKTNQSVSLAGDQLPTGAELAFNCKRKGQSASERTLFLATKIRISSARYTAWDIDSESEGPEEEEEADFDMLDNSEESPSKLAPKSKGKEKALATTPFKDTTVKIEKPDLDSPLLPDMKKAARMRTRIFSGALEWKPVLRTDPISGSSDDERPETIEVSDDDTDLPDPSALSASIPSSANIHTTQPTSNHTSPLFTQFASDRSPSPEPEYNISLPPYPTENMSGTSSGWASTSSFLSSSSTIVLCHFSLGELIILTLNHHFFDALSLGTSSAAAWASSLSLPSTTVYLTPSASASTTSVGSNPSAAGPSRPTAFMR